MSPIQRWIRPMMTQNKYQRNEVYEVYDVCEEGTLTLAKKKGSGLRCPSMPYLARSTPYFFLRDAFFVAFFLATFFLAAFFLVAFFLAAAMFFLLVKLKNYCIHLNLRTEKFVVNLFY